MFRPFLAANFRPVSAYHASKQAYFASRKPPLRTFTKASATQQRSASMVTESAAERPLETATFGMGCFWCPDKKFCKVEGVVSTSVGYTGGSRPNPTYGSVCSGDGHTEAIRVTYDPKVVSYDDLLKVFLEEHNPLRKAKTQYKSAVWTHSPEQEAAVKQALQSYEQTRGKQVATDVAPAAPWTDAEDYHQKYSVSKTASTLQDHVPKKRFSSWL